MAQTVRSELPYFTDRQQNPELTWVKNIRVMSALMHCKLQSISVSAEPGGLTSADEEKVWYIPTTPAATGGDWNDNEAFFAIYFTTGWEFVLAYPMVAYVVDVAGWRRFERFVGWSTATI